MTDALPALPGSVHDLSAADLLDAPSLRDPVLHAPERLAEVQRLVLSRDDVQELVADLLSTAAGALSAPTAMLGVVLDDMHLVVGGHGMDGWLEQARAFPADWSFCARTVRQGTPYLLPDAAAAPEWDGNPIVAVDGVRAYAGAPVVSASGQVLGALCVVDGAARAWDDSDATVLAALAAIAAGRLEAAALPAPRDGRA